MEAMMSQDTEDTRTYLVLVNPEEQYSLWPKDNPVPNGWRNVKEGSKAECLQYVKENWTDMRPLSLRKHMEEHAARMAQQQPPQS
jgi:MbtH protein